MLEDTDLLEFRIVMNICTSTHGQDYLYITSNFKYILIEAITRKVKPGSSLCVSKLPSLRANCATVTA